MQLYLIRHPAPDVAPGVCYGRSDLALAEDVGGAAARVLPQLPPGVAIYSSPLRRCMALARGLHPSPRGDARLVEMNFGEWEMQPWHVIQRTALDGWAADPLGYAPPQGESVAELRARVLDFVADARRDGVRRAALVTHAGVMKILVGHSCKLPADRWLGLHFEYESVVRVDIEDPPVDG